MKVVRLEYERVQRFGQRNEAREKDLDFASPYEFTTINKYFRKK